MLSSADGRAHWFPLRVLAGVPLGAVFIGSTLVGFVGPASSATALAVALTSEDANVEAGTPVTVNMRVNDVRSDRTCLYDAETDNGVTAEDLDFEIPLPSARATGAPEESVSVTATVTYAALGDHSDCGEVPATERRTVESEPLPGEVVPPEKGEGEAWGKPPTKHEERDRKGPPDKNKDKPRGKPPTKHEGGDSPGDGGGPDDKEPDWPPRKDPTHAPTSDPGSPSLPSDGSTEHMADDPDDGSGESAGGDSHGDSAEGGQAAPPGGDPLPEGPDAPRDNGDAEGQPSLPSGSADLPEVTPSAGEDHADLPTVEPDGSEEPSSAATAPDSRSLVVTAVMLLAVLVLLLLLAAPLGPARRVRAGSGYVGQRRRS